MRASCVPPSRHINASYMTAATRSRPRWAWSKVTGVRQLSTSCCDAFQPEATIKDGGAYEGMLASRRSGGNEEAEDKAG